MSEWVMSADRSMRVCCLNWKKKSLVCIVCSRYPMNSKSIFCLLWHTLHAYTWLDIFFCHHSMPSNGEHIPRPLESETIATGFYRNRNRCHHLHFTLLFFIRFCSSISMQSVIKVGFHSSPLLYCSVRAKNVYCLCVFNVFFIFQRFLLIKNVGKSSSYNDMQLKETGFCDVLNRTVAV